MVVVKLSTSRLKLSEQQVQPNVTVAKTETLFCDDRVFFSFFLFSTRRLCAVACPKNPDVCPSPVIKLVTWQFHVSTMRRTSDSLLDLVRSSAVLNVPTYVLLRTC